MTLEEQFQDAQERVNGLPAAPDQMTLLDLYGLYKQSNVGDATGKRPGMMDFRKRAKFDAWSGRKGMSNDEAMTAYVELVDRLVADA
jgi:acyl-CoA-binding protein